MKTFLIALRATFVTLLVCGLAYPLVVTGLAQLIFPSRANGSIVSSDQGKELGSELIGQAFTRAEYLWPRPSAAGDKGFDATSSAASNLGPTSQKLRERTEGEAKRLGEANPGAPGPVPAELVTTSGSGLDPHLSPEAALWQVPRVAKARGVTVERVRAVVLDHVEGRDLGLLGEPRVNVLAVNLALDRQFGRVELAR